MPDAGVNEHMRRRLFVPDVALAPPQTAGHPLAIVDFRAWRLKEPVSGRRYTVVKLQSRSGETGYGEGGPAPRSEIVEARAALCRRRATESEFIRARLACIPAMEAAVSNAMLDLLANPGRSPSTSSSAARLVSRPGSGADSKEPTRRPPRPLDRAKRQGFRAFTLPVLQRDSMIPLQEYVDRVRERVAKVQANGATARMGSRRCGH